MKRGCRAGRGGTAGTAKKVEEAATRRKLGHDKSTRSISFQRNLRTTKLGVQYPEFILIFFGIFLVTPAEKALQWKAIHQAYDTPSSGIQHYFSLVERLPDIHVAQPRQKSYGIIGRMT